MKIFFNTAISTVAMAGLCLGQGSMPNSSGNTPAQQNLTGQTAPANGKQSGNRMRIAPGSVIPVQLSKTIDAKKAKPGEEVDAQVTEDLKADNGEIIVPKNMKIVGRVTEAQARKKEQKESQVGIAFDHAVTKDGSEVALPMSIQAIIAPSYLTGGNPNSTAQSGSQPASSPITGGMTPGNNSRAPSMGAPQTENPSAAAGEEPGTNAGSSTARQPITGKTQGVLGMQNMSLSSASTNAQGSVVSSEKNNVKLEGGTLMLLRVNQ
jgi:hypothetical protein